MIDESVIAKAKELVGKVARGEITEDSHPDLFDDEVVYLAVRTIEGSDLPWLLARLDDDKHPRAARRALAREMTSPERNSRLEALSGDDDEDEAKGGKGKKK